MQATDVYPRITNSEEFVSQAAQIAQRLGDVRKCKVRFMVVISPSETTVHVLVNSPERGGTTILDCATNVLTEASRRGREIAKELSALGYEVDWQDGDWADSTKWNRCGTYDRTLMAGSMESARQHEAEQAYEGFALEGRNILSTDGWEFASATAEQEAAEWRRVLYVAEKSGESRQATFVTRFYPGTALVEQAYISGE